jgi:hypothetical protein
MLHRLPFVRKQRIHRPCTVSNYTRELELPTTHTGLILFGLSRLLEWKVLERFISPYKSKSKSTI